MLAIVISAAATCFVSLFLGQAALRLAGAREWNWLAPAVGISVAMMVATPTNHVPGRAMTMFVLVAALSVAAAIWCLRSPAHRPPLRDLLAAAPVAFLVLLPFLANGRPGVLGVSINNDMVAHLLFVETYVSAAVEAAVPLPTDYPLGPHAMSALLADGLGVRPEYAFSGWTMAATLINAWTALAAARRASWFGKAVAATVVGLPFLVAAYYGQGAFKEVLQAGLVLAVVLALSGCGPQLSRFRWVPLALLVGGIISVYSLTGLPWPLAFLGLWLAGLLAIEIWREGPRSALRKAKEAVRAELPAIAIGLAVLVVFLLPQTLRLLEFLSLRQGTGIPVDDIGNLIGPLPGWEALGVWNNPDFRRPAEPAFSGGMWAAFVLGLVLIGTVWAFRRGRWLLPGAAATALLIWKISDASQSPYVSAKALVIASPLLLLVAVLPLIDREERRPRWWPVVPLVALVLLFKVGVSDERALRWSPVGSVDQAEELEALRPIVGGQQVLFLGPTEFARFDLAGSPVNNAIIGGMPYLTIRPRKEWEYGQALDFDSLNANPTLNEFNWIVTTRDAAASAPPPGLKPVKTTRFFVLWQRVAEIPERSILREGEWPGRVLQCETKEGREVLAAGGVAAVRPLPKVVPVAPVAPGGSASVQLTLDPGTWELGMPYVSPQEIEVTSPVLETTLPPYLDRPGQRWRLGRVTLDRTRRLTFTFAVDDNFFTSPIVPAILNNLVAIRRTPERLVPVERACGLYVDWYRSER